MSALVNSRRSERSYLRYFYKKLAKKIIMLKEITELIKLSLEEVRNFKPTLSSFWPKKAFSRRSEKYQ